MSQMLRRKKQGPVRAKKTIVDGISFSSGLEAYMYKALKEANIRANYEGYTYDLIREFDFNIDVYERCANGKGDYKNRGHKTIRKISYTPDFIGEGFSAKELKPRSYSHDLPHPELLSSLTTHLLAQALLLTLTRVLA